MKTITSLPKTLLTLLFSASAALFVPMEAGAAPQANAAVAALPDFTDLVEKTGPAVVNIRTTQRVKQGANQGMPGGDDEEMQEFLRRFFGMPAPQQPNQPSQPNRRKKQVPEDHEEEVPRGVGSGFIISPDGYVMTNAHVVEAADEVYVTLTDKREFKAKIVGADKNSDVALVKIEGANLPHLTMGASDKIRVGEWVIAIGSPFDAAADLAANKVFCVSVWYANKTWFEADAARSRRIVQAIYDTARWANAHRDDTFNVLVRDGQLDPVQARGMQRTTYATTLTADLIAPVITIGNQNKMFSKPTDAASLITKA